MAYFLIPLLHEKFIKWLILLILSFCHHSEWIGVATWRWVANDDNCGICRMAFDGCCPDCKIPGDDCPLGCWFDALRMVFALFSCSWSEERMLID
nr:uncharacterized protein LOC131785182 isoform X2 [Pocillopora verrucosa]